MREIPFLKKNNSKLTRITLRNYTPEDKWKVGHIARHNMLYYKIQVYSNILKRHVHQITNVRPKISLANDTIFEEKYTENYRSENTLAGKIATLILNRYILVSLIFNQLFLNLYTNTPSVK